MTLAEIMQPFAIIFNWMRTYVIHLGEFSFSFMDLFVWGLFASIIMSFISKLIHG